MFIRMANTFSLSVFKQNVGYLGWNSQNAYQNGKHFFSFCFQTKCWLSGLEFTKCLLEWLTLFFFLFSNKMLVIWAGIHRMLIRMANTFYFLFFQTKFGYLGCNSQTVCQNDNTFFFLLSNKLFVLYAVIHKMLIRMANHFSLSVFKQNVGYLCWNSQNAYQNGKPFFSFCFQTKCWLSGLEFTKCLSEWQTLFLFLFSNKMLVIWAGVHKMFIRMANTFSLSVFKQNVGYLGWNSQNAYQNGKHFFSFCFQTKCWLSGLEFTKCLSEWQTLFLFLFSNKMLVIWAGIHRMLIRMANTFYFLFFQTKFGYLGCNSQTVCQNDNTFFFLLSNKLLFSML